MTSLHVIENKIASVERYLGILQDYSGLTADDVKNDVTLRGAIERYLYLVAQATIDLAEATIAYRGYRKPTTYRESFEILVEQKAIPADLGERIMRMAAFRNMLAHAYEHITCSAMMDVMGGSLSDVAEFAEEIKRRT